MTRPSKLAVSAINVRIIDKTRRDYVALFRAVMSLRRPVRVYANDYLLLTKFGRIESATKEIEWGGAFGKFTEISEDSEWLDTTTLQAADDDQLDGVQIPDNLKPNYEGFFFVLFPEEHIIAFETYSKSSHLSPFFVEKWLKSSVEYSRIIKSFGRVEVDIIPDYDVLTKILESEKIRKLEITVRLPNPDDFDVDMFERVEARLRSLNAQTEETKYTAPRGEYLELDDETKALARVGAENGQVDARIREDGSVVPKSTARHPISVQDTYNADDVANEAFFRALAIRVRQAVRRNRGR